MTAHTILTAHPHGGKIITEDPQGFYPYNAAGIPQLSCWTPGVPPQADRHADADVVTKLPKPLHVDDLVEAVEHLERVYGPGLVFDSTHPDSDRFMVVARPFIDALGEAA